MEKKPTKTGQRRGKRHPVEFALHPDTGDPVQGLRSHKATGLYYRLDPQPGGKRSKSVYYPQRGLKGTAYLRRAVFEHECHAKNIDPSPPLATISIESAIPVYDSIGGSVVETFSATMFDEAGNLQTILPVHKADLVRYFRDILLDPVQRKDWATAMAVPELAYLERLRPDAHSLTLATVIERYLAKTPPLKSDTIGKFRKFWAEFTKSVGVERVSEITPDHIRTYRDWVYSQRKSPTYVKHRFGLIKSAFSYNLTEGEDPENLQRVLTHCKMLRNLKPATVKANPISRIHFRAILDKADKRSQAMMLLALNCGMYPIDVAGLRKAAIDLDMKTLQDYRSKTGILRVAVLWDRTVTALRDYWAEQPNDTDFVFLSGLGMPYAKFGRNHITKYFRKYRDLAKVDQSVKFDNIRDGTQSAAIQGGAQEIHVNMILGHKVGIADAYLKRNPKMVAEACAAVEKYYFGPDMGGDPSPNASGKNATR